MQVQLKQLDIEKAIVAYLSAQGIKTDGKFISMSFTSGRKDNGLSVEIAIEDPVVDPVAVPTTATAPEPQSVENPVEETEPEEPAEVTPEPPTEVTPTTSLFS